jgi:hypothetical protein
MHADLPDTPLDIVGDVHGEHEALRALLAALGYDAAGRHRQGRHLVFVGDLCDRGPDSPGVVARVRALVERDRAVALLGNHEINLLRGQRKSGNDWFWGEDAHHDRRFAPYISLRDDAERGEVVAFFNSLPLAASRPDLRVVHAAWHVPSLERLGAARVDMQLGQWFEQLDAAAEAAQEASGLRAAACAEKTAWRHHLDDPVAAVPMLQAVGCSEEARQMDNPLCVLTSGVERCTQMPFFASGQWRFTERVRWWDAYENDTPVVVGHYWRQFLPLDRTQLDKAGPDLFEGTPAQAWMGARGNVFCVDFSAGGRWQERRAGCNGARTRLAALRWPERDLVLDSGEVLPTTGFCRG